MTNVQATTRLVLDTALMTTLAHTTFDGILAEGDHWGRLVESAVGAHLLNGTTGTGIEVQYWLDRNREVDFLLVAGDAVTASQLGRVIMANGG